MRYYVYKILPSFIRHTRVKQQEREQKYHGKHFPSYYVVLCTRSLYFIIFVYIWDICCNENKSEKRYLPC